MGLFVVKKLIHNHFNSNVLPILCSSKYFYITQFNLCLIEFEIIYHNHITFHFLLHICLKEKNLILRIIAFRKNLLKH